MILPPGAVAVPEYYDSRQHWPAESLARREALLAPAAAAVRLIRRGPAMPASDAAQPPGQVVRVNGTDIFYRACGQGSPLLLLHGGTLSGDSWRPYLAGFAEHYRVITPDTPGHGRSGTPPGELSYRGLADAIAAFAEALGLGRPLIAGYSDGGQIALEIGLRHPDLPRALVLGGTLFRFNPGYRAWLEAVVGDPASPLVDTARFARDHPGWAAWLQRTYGPDGWQPLLARVKPLWTAPLAYGPDDFARIARPGAGAGRRPRRDRPGRGAAELYRRLPAAELAWSPAPSTAALLGQESTSSTADARLPARRSPR